MQSLVAGLVVGLVTLVFVGWATLNPVVTGWNIASSIPVTQGDVDPGQRSLRIRLNPTDSDHLYLFDFNHSELFESLDGGQLWSALKIVPDADKVVDIAVNQKEICLLYPASIECHRKNGADWKSVQLPETDDSLGVTTLAADPQNEDRLGIGFSNGRIDLSEDDGKTWRTVGNLAGAFSVFRLGFSGDHLIAIPASGAKATFVIDLATGNFDWLYPQPAWPATPNDLSVPSLLGRFLVVVGEKEIVDTDVGGGEWNSYSEPPPESVLSLAAWGNDLYVVGSQHIYCNRLWTWRQLNWWRTRLGLRTPCFS